MTDEQEDQVARLARIELLISNLSEELASLREEGRVVSESMAADSRAKAARARRSRQEANRAKASAEARGKATRARIAAKKR